MKDEYQAKVYWHCHIACPNPIEHYKATRKISQDETWVQLECLSKGIMTPQMEYEIEKQRLDSFLPQGVGVLFPLIPIGILIGGLLGVGIILLIAWLS